MDHPAIHYIKMMKEVGRQEAYCHYSTIMLSRLHDFKYFNSEIEKENFPLFEQCTG